jgi:eukaryotic-like serine/threonine-protein kinase
VMGVLGEGKPVYRFRNRYRNAQGEYKMLEWTAKSVIEERTIFAVARDVTDEK